MPVETVQDGRFKCVAADIEAVVAGALRAGVCASEHVLRDHRIAATTAAAFDEPGEQVLRAPTVVHGKIIARQRARLHCQLILPRLHGVPEVLVDDAQFGHIVDGPVRFRIEAGYPLARVWVLQIAQPVPDQLADIEFVVEDAGSALRVAMNGRWTPFAALRTGNTFGVQHHRDGAGGFARKVVGEYSSNDIGFRLVDGSFTAVCGTGLIELTNDVIAVAETTAGFAVFDPAAQAPPGLVGEILQVKRAHGALQADMQFADFALGKRDDADAGKAHALVEAGDIFLVAGEAVE